MQEFESKSEELLQSYRFDQQRPPMLLCNNIELKLYLMDLSSEFEITGNLEVDNGHSFTYQIQVFFPVYFQEQVRKCVFDLYDTFPNEEKEGNQAIISAVGMSFSKQMANMKHFSETERKKSRLGAVRKQRYLFTFFNIGQFHYDISQEATSNFESETKLKIAQWLPHVCF